MCEGGFNRQSVDLSVRRKGTSQSTVRVTCTAEMGLKSQLLRCLGLARHDLYVAKSLKRIEWLYRPGCHIPQATIAMAPVMDPTPADVSFCERLIAAYQSSNRSAGGPIWSSIISSEYEQMRDSLENQRGVDLAFILSRMFRSSCVHGIASGDLYKSTLAKRIWQLKLFDDSVSLAEYLGVVRVENPEQGAIGKALVDGLAPLVDRIEERVGPIGFPCVGGPYGIYAGDRLLTMETPEYIYVAARIREAVRGNLPRLARPEILEIGAGFGGTALFVLRFMPEVKRYVIVDLPIINVLQGYFLGKCFGFSAVSFFQEPNARIQILPPSELAAQSCDILLNENSMPEMPAETVCEYLKWASGNVRGIFYSYQQEAWNSQVLVPDAIAQCTSLIRLSRNPSWVRRGYVEEVYAHPDVCKGACFH